jgi:hypothetical protein
VDRAVAARGAERTLQRSRRHTGALAEKGQTQSKLSSEVELARNQRAEE